MIDGYPLSFFLPLVVHILAGLTTGITGVVMFRKVIDEVKGEKLQWLL